MKRMINKVVGKKVSLYEALNRSREIIERVEAERAFLYYLDYLENKDEVMSKDKILDKKTVEKVNISYWFNLVIDNGWKFTEGARLLLEKWIMEFEKPPKIKEIKQMTDKGIANTYNDLLNESARR